MKKNQATMQEVLDQYHTLQKIKKTTPKHITTTQDNTKKSKVEKQPDMLKWLEMFPPTGSKQEDKFNPSRHQKVNNLKAERELDLHGMTWSEAEYAMDRFIDKAQADGIIAVRIIHGKGNRSQVTGGVLKPKVISYLQQDKRIKKVNQAGFKDGQSGACHVIIKLTAI